MPEWRRALAAALIGGVSACIFTVIWGNSAAFRRNRTDPDTAPGSVHLRDANRSFQ